jgi:DNA repair protein RecO
MSLFTDEALVLDSHPYQDRHLILALLSRGRGLVRGVLRGARGGRAPRAAATQILSLVRVTVYESRRAELATFREIDLITSSYPLAASIERSTAAAVVAELLLTFCPAGEPAPRRFRLGKTMLLALLDGVDVATVVAYAQFWSLQLGGVLPPPESSGLVPADLEFLAACRTRPPAEVELPVPDGLRRWLDRSLRAEAERPLHALDFFRRPVE